MPYIELDAAAATAVTTSLGSPLTSAGETLLSLRDEIKLALGNRPDLDATRITKYINFAYQDIASSLRLEELIGSESFSTVGAQPLYKLPYAMQGVSRKVGLIDTVTFPSAGGIALEKKDLDWYRSQPVDTQDAPLYYFRYNELLIIYPTPKVVKTIVVDFRIQPVNLTNDTHSPILPLYWHEGLLLLAKTKVAYALLDRQIGEEFENDYVRWVRRRSDKEADEQEGLLAIARPVKKDYHLRRPFSHKVSLDIY